MLGTKAASRQDLAIQAIAFVILVAILVWSWRVLNIQSLMNQGFRLRAPDMPLIVLDGNAAMHKVAATWQAAIVVFFSALGFATAQNARAVGMWPQTATGSFGVAAWSALAFASVAMAVAALVTAILPAPSLSDVTSLGAVPACLTAILALQAVSAWLLAHAISRGWEMVNGKARNPEFFGCACLVGCGMFLISLTSYGFLTFPINIYLPRPHQVAQSDLSVVPLYWITGRIGLPDWMCLAVPLVTSVLTVLAGAWLVCREPLRPGMLGRFMSRQRKT